MQSTISSYGSESSRSMYDDSDSESQQQVETELLGKTIHRANGGEFTIVSFLGDGTFGMVVKVTPLTRSAVAKKTNQRAGRNARGRGRGVAAESKSASGTASCLQQESMMAAKVFREHIATEYVNAELEVLRAARGQSHLLFTDDDAASVLQCGQSRYRCVFVPMMDMSLRRFLDEIALGALDKTSVATVMRGVATALRQMHDVGYLHLDVKTDNLLLRCDGQRVLSVRLCDFGAATKQPTPASWRAVGLTPGYSAPEALLGCAELLGQSADVYSYGCIAYELLTLQPLFVMNHGPTSDLLSEAGQIDPSYVGSYPAEVVTTGTNRKRYFTATGAVRFGRAVNVRSPWTTDHLSPVVKSFVQSCVSVNPHARPTMAQLRRWIANHLQHDAAVAVEQPCASVCASVSHATE